MPEKTVSMDAISCKKAIRCTTPSCLCECFLPSKGCLRTCESCKHGWVAHALDKLGYRHVFNVGLQVEIVQPNIVFDIASLMLYGAQATPIRLKILLDRLFSVLQHEEVLQVLHGFGWSYEDYARGYILQETSGRVLDKWICATREEEFIIMQQFLRFGETKSIAQEIILQDTKERQDNYIKQTTRNESEIKKFIERSNLSMQNLIRPFDVRHLFGARLPFIGPAGNRLLSPPLPGFSTPSSSPRDLRPPLISVTSTSPIATSPLGRLQTMQPFDYRRESASPASISPSDKQQSRSPKSDSPQNLSVTSAQSTPPHTPYTPQKVSDIESPLSHIPIMPPSVSMGGPSMVLPTLQRHHNSDEGVINFSLKEDQDSLYIDRKNKHLRKSSNPIKRNWIPDPSFGTSMIGPNGKKRVLCSACNKTFCDKGALKIHYSAVHLKEMHKCSVEGCTMMFSSRRSRNRHSANPNPKLHMPQKRPKIPDGARLVDDGSSPSQKRQLSTPPSMVISPSMVSGSPVNLAESPNQRPFYADPNIQMPVFPTAAKRLKLDSDDEGPKDLSLPLLKSGQNSRETSPGNVSLSLVPEHMLEEYQHAMKESLDDIKEMEPSDALSSNSLGPARSQSRRKNIPIRCAQPTDSYGEAGDQNEKSGILDKNECDESNDDSKEIDHNEDRRVPNDQEVEQGDVDIDCSNSDVEETSIDKSDNKLIIDDNSDEDDDDEDDDEDINGKDTGEVLDFAMHMPEGMDSEQFMNASGQDSNTSMGSNDSVDMTKSNGEVMSEGEIPIDKDNPKQCVACGKTFLNIFGLKIHYKNVHLKLMHTCTVDGCSASFPSKRSRDRHSSNLNLHRKLLSTTEEQISAEDADDNQNFRADIIQKLYENQNCNQSESKKNSIINGENNHNNSIEKKEYVEDVCEEGENGMDVENERTNNDSCDDSQKGICNTCDADFADEESLQKHIDSKHASENIPSGAKSLEKVSPTRKSRRQMGHDGFHKTLSSNEKALAV
ncbi:zinc finger protein basonuclin-1-like isoform X2 [Ruditapes philippinarum]|uniref:zinc finger protein basonuclin-1-like isoform X2 n=1 Tax=Ruditapes philippinarum TaxID=129788 RepID=UPI00295C184C|nr:zinc finger protein basonuclin-1-like isoform X2 [Ruditapes philippinarum]